MAELIAHIDLSNEAIKEIEKAQKQVAISEARIREIIRDELAAWEKRMVQALRFGTPLRAEVK